MTVSRSPQNTAIGQCGQLVGSLEEAPTLSAPVDYVVDRSGERSCRASLRVHGAEPCRLFVRDHVSHGLDANLVPSLMNGWPRCSTTNGIDARRNDQAISRPSPPEDTRTMRRMRSGHWSSIIWATPPPNEWTTTSALPQTTQVIKNIQDNFLNVCEMRSEEHTSEL